MKIRWIFSQLVILQDDFLFIYVFVDLHVKASR